METLVNASQIEVLRKILQETNSDDLEENVLNWVNDLLRVVADNNSEREQDDTNEESEDDHQHIGGGISNIHRSGKHQKI